MKTTPPPLPAHYSKAEPLSHWLARYMGKRRRFIATTALAVAVTAALALGMGAALADVFLTLDPWLRWTALAATIGLLAWLAATGVLRAIRLQRRQAMDEIEAMLPAQGQLIRTALEESAAEKPQDPVRALLTQGLLGRATEVARRFKPERQLPWSSVRRRWIGAGAAALVLLALTAAWPDFRTAARRLLMPSGGITFTRLDFVDPPREIVAGNECRLTVQVSGRRADPPRLAVQRGEVLEPPTAMQPDPAVPGRFFLSLGKPGAALTVHATAGDGATRLHSIPVVYPPKLKEVTADLTYPEYTGLKPATQNSPDIEAVESSQVTVTVTTDRPLTSGKVEFSDGTTAAVAFNGPVATFSAPLNRGSLTWKLAATDDRGLSPAAAGGKWVGLEDKPPKIEWVTPKNDIEATPLAEVTLRAKAKDDFGLLQTGVIIQAGGRERTLHTEDFAAADGVPVSAVMEALAELEQENTTIRDNVKVFAFARDRFPAPAGRERRGVSDLRNIDIRQFKVWRALIEGGGDSPPPPRAQKALLKLEQIIKQQRGIVNTVFRLKEENVREEPPCRETAGRQRQLGEGTAELKSALLQSEMPPPADDMVLLDTAAQQMTEAAASLDSLDVPPAWTSADGALTSLLELRREFMKLMSRNGKPCDCEQKPDDFQLPTLTELAKEAERLAQEEEAVANGLPRARENTVEAEKLASRQASAQSDAGELFDKIVTHPEVTDLAQSRMSRAEQSMAQATRDLRDRQTEPARPSLQSAQESLSHLAQHLRGLDASQAAPTLKAAADMAQRSADDMKRSGQSPAESPASGQSASPSDTQGGSPSGGLAAGTSAGQSGSTSDPAANEDSASSPAARAAENAATINDWLKHLARSESLGRTAERLGALQRESGVEDLAGTLAGLAAHKPGTPSPDADQAGKAAAGNLESLAAALAAEHQRLVQGTLEKLTAAQAATRALQANGSKPGKPPGSGTGSQPSAGSPAASPGSSASGSPGSNAGSATGGRSASGQGWGIHAPGFTTAQPGSLRYAQDLADLLNEFQDSQLTELSDALIRQHIEAGYNRNVDDATLGTIDARLEALIQEVIQRQILAGKSDRVPPEFEARVEGYFRRLSEDTGDEEEEPADDSATSDPAGAGALKSAIFLTPPADPQAGEQPFSSPGLRLLPDQ